MGVGSCMVCFLTQPAAAKAGGNASPVCTQKLQSSRTRQRFGYLWPVNTAVVHPISALCYSWQLHEHRTFPALAGFGAALVRSSSPVDARLDLFAENSQHVVPRKKVQSLKEDKKRKQGREETHENYKGQTARAFGYITYRHIHRAGNLKHVSLGG